MRLEVDHSSSRLLLDERFHFPPGRFISSIVCLDNPIVDLSERERERDIEIAVELQWHPSRRPLRFGEFPCSDSLIVYAVRFQNLPGKLLTLEE